MRPVAFLIALTFCLSCSGDDQPAPDTGQPPDATPDQSIAGDSCSKVQQCAQACDADDYAECVAACKENASEKALELLEAYEECAAAAVDGECSEQCTAGPTAEACEDCVLAACLVTWNNCYEDF